jgi:AcrR family transcriptional regulator
MSRRRPQQDRSRATVERIVAAADAAFAAHGSAAVTTTQIAAAAGVSVGALYRFFPDKEAIAAALAERYLDEARLHFGPLLAAVHDRRELPGVIGEVIDAAAALALRHRGYYQLTREVAPGDAGSAGVGVRRAIVDDFDELLVRLGAPPDDPRRRVTITLLIETVRHTLATAPPDEPARGAVVAELRAMVVGHAERRLRP